MNRPILQVKGLRKNFGGLAAVDNVDISFAPGKLHALLGPNGAGKTTFFNLVSGLIKPDSGEIFLEDRNISRLKPFQISRLGVARTLQIKSIFHELSVFDNLWVTAKSKMGFLHPFRSADRYPEVREKVDRVIEQFGLQSMAHQQAGMLSYGDVALLEMAVAVISDPKLLLLDEPLCGMSPGETDATVRIILELSRQTNVIIIEHDMPVILEIADDITVMAQGRVLATGTPSEISGNQAVQEAYLGQPETTD
jgi:branched-chain amino acid transport system ATP-binding protein